MENMKLFTANEILNTLAKEYTSAHRVYASMEKQAEMALAKGDMIGYQNAKGRANVRSSTLYGIKRAAASLGFNEVVFMEAVSQVKHGIE